MNKTNAKITRIELVNGSMLSFTLDLPKGTCAYDFTAGIPDVLNEVTEGSKGFVNSFATETDLKVGDEITQDGEIIAAAVAEAKIEETVLNTAKAGDYRDAFSEKNGSR